MRWGAGNDGLKADGDSGADTAAAAADAMTETEEEAQYAGAFSQRSPHAHSVG